MNAATLQVVISAAIRLLDLVDRVARKRFDNSSELEAYIAERNQVRKELVDLAVQLQGDESPDQDESSDDAQTDEPDEDDTDPGTEGGPADETPTDSQPV